MDNEETKQTNKRVPFTQLSQVDSDFAVAMALQQQEREFLMLMMSESDTDEFNDESEASNDDDDEFDEFLQDDDEINAELEDLEEEESSNDQDMEDDDIDPDELSYEELIALGEVLGTENKGLSENELGIYLHPYTFKRQSESKYGFDQCVICQVEFEDEEPVVALPCEHAYHSECVSKWLQISKVCPICSTEVSSSALAKTT